MLYVGFGGGWLVGGWSDPTHRSDRYCVLAYSVGHRQNWPIPTSELAVLYVGLVADGLSVAGLIPLIAQTDFKGILCACL